MTLGAIILAGGPSRRMGEDKAALDWGGRTAVARLGEVAVAAGATAIVTVGGRDQGLPWVADDAPDGGPVAGVVAGARALAERGCRRMLVLAVDAPTLRVDDLEPLLSSTGAGAAYDGLNLPFVLDLDTMPADAGPGWPVARLLDRCGVVRQAPPGDAALRLRGANTPAERAVLLDALIAAEAAEKDGAG